MSKFADAVVARFGKGAGEAASPPGNEDKSDAPEAEGDKPGAKGKLLAAALKRGDGEAIEEAIRSICE